MSKPQQLQLQRMCGKPETVDKALSLLITASARTGPGSGHDIGQGGSGLAAICAFLASQQLGNDDVSEKTAQAASCLAPKIFKPTLATVRKVVEQAEATAHLNDTPRQRRTRTQTNVTYPSLLASHKVLLEDVVAGWLEDAERLLDSLPEFRATYNAEMSTVKCTVFFWVCQVIGLSRINRKLMTERYDIDIKASDELVTMINTHGGDLKDTIASQVEQMKRKKTPGRKTKTATPAATHVPPPITMTDSRTSVSESAPESSNDQGSATSEVPAARELLLSPRKSAMKRPIPADPATPRRAVKFISSSQSLPQLELAGGSRPSSPSKKRKTLPSDVMENDETTPKEPETPHRSSRHTANDDDPMTPVRSARRGTGSVSPSKRQRKPRSPSPEAAADDSDGEEEEFLPMPRHYRPMFADRQQWLACDPRAERDLAAVRRAAVKAEGLWGHPFAHLRGQEALRMHV